MSRRPRKRTLIALLLVLAISSIVALILASANSVKNAGALYSESHSGTITGTLGSIHCLPSGGNGAENLDLQFSNLLPGENQTVTSSCTNNGNSPEDVYVVFKNPTALSALNSLGTYGEVHLKGNGSPLFDSANLNDRSASCGSFSPSGCWPLKAVYQLASNVSPSATTTLSFTFGYASKLSANPPVGPPVPWNSYPVGPVCGPGPTFPDPCQVTVNAGDGTGNGLPYKFVVEQVGAPAPTS